MFVLYFSKVQCSEAFLDIKFLSEENMVKTKEREIITKNMQQIQKKIKKSEKKVLSSLFSNILNTLSNQKSPVHLVYESSGGTVSITDRTILCLI